MKINPLFQTDFYKQGHFKMYVPGTTKIYSNLTPRKSRMPGVNHVIFFGLQYFIKQYLQKEWKENFFDRNIEDVRREYCRMIDNTLGKGSIDFSHIERLHKLGYLPLSIKALPEGAKVPVRVPCLTIANTVDHAYWLVNFLETILSCVLWQPITSATIAHEFNKILSKYALETVGNTDFVQWQGHDFSHRGMSSLESACLSGAGHLLSFTGTDTVPAIAFLEQYYNVNIEKELCGASVPATEHSIMSLGLENGEIETFERLLDTFPDGILSVVSDTWSLPNVICKILPALKDKIKSRNGKLVIRPDSFWTDPVDCICGFDGYHPQMQKLNGEEIKMVNKGLIESLWDLFGGTVNTKGYKELDPHIGAIYGDSITMERAEKISFRLKNKGFASTNCVYGVGSYTYQMNTRDTFGLAVKATYGEINGDPREIHKDPITDDGMKKSAKGLLRVDIINGEYVLKDCVSKESEYQGELKEVFRNGELLIEHSLNDIRSKIKNG